MKHGFNSKRFLRDILFSLGFIPALENVFMAHGSVRDF
jgi:hypothetical protein